MTCTDAQVRLAMSERKKSRSQEQAAVKANIKSRKTVAKYEQLGGLPSENKRPRSYRTRPDPFAEDWAEIEKMLERSPELEAQSLLAWLDEQYPGKYQEGQLRTLQRRVKDWRVLNHKQVAVLEQAHQPGEALQTDGTWLTELGISINGQPLPHMLIHCVLPYSNWEWGAIAQSESLLALQRALHSTLRRLGYVPAYHQTDNSSAATYRLGEAEATKQGERAYNPAYVALLAQFGLKPRAIHVGCPEQNGDIEAANGQLKHSLNQQLLLRGSREFESLADYEAFVEKVMHKRNQGRQARLQEEIAVMKPVPIVALPPYQAVRVKVNRNSMIRVQHNLYSVPTNLIGQQVTVRIYEWHLEVYYRQTQVEWMRRLVGQNKHHIQYRHLIDTLLHKPGGFRQYRYREALFPSLVFRRAWDQLQTWHTERQADLIYLRILRLAARVLECEVAEILERLLAGTKRWDETDVAAALQLRRPQAPPALTPLVVDLTSYDRLLKEVSCDPA